MPLVQTDAGDILTLETLIARWNGVSPIRIHLVKADWVPAPGTVAADMPEADFPGYNYEEASGWTTPTIVAGRGQTAADPVVFTRTTTGAAQTIYGYWAEEQAAAGTVYWSEKFATAVVLSNADEALVVYPVYTQNTEFLA